MAKTMPTSLVKEEIMISDFSDNSDNESRIKIDERKKVLCIKLVKLQFAKTTYPKRNSDSYHQESYIKEELIISDVSDSSDVEEANKIINKSIVREKSPLRIEESETKCPIIEEANKINNNSVVHEKSTVKTQESEIECLITEDSNKTINKSVVREKLPLRIQKSETESPITEEANKINYNLDVHEKSSRKTQESETECIITEDANKIINKSVAGEKLPLRILKCENESPITKEANKINNNSDIREKLPLRTQESETKFPIIEEANKINYNLDVHEKSSRRTEESKTECLITEEVNKINNNSVVREKSPLRTQESETESSITEARKKINNNSVVREKSPLTTQESETECLITDAILPEDKLSELHKISRELQVVLKRLTLYEIHKKNTYNNVRVDANNKLADNKNKQKTNKVPYVAVFNAVVIESKSSKKNSSEDNLYHCNNCNRKYRLKQRLIYHIKNKHSDALDANGYAKCKKCKEKFLGLLGVKKHMKICGVPPHLYCKFCPMKMKFKNGLKLHILRMHKNVDPANIDGIIDKIVKKGKKLLEDGALKLTSKDIPYKSQKQSRRFTVEKLLLYCSNCDKSQKRIIGKNPSNCQVCQTPLLHECAKCAKRYKVLLSAKSHLYEKCNGREQYRCDDCNGNFTTLNKNSLSRHMLNKHVVVEEKDMHSCQRCGKLFKTKPNLWQHERMCGKGPELSCPHCQYKSKYKSTMRNHISSHKLHLSIAVDNSKVSAAVAKKSVDNTLQGKEKGESFVNCTEVIVDNPSIEKAYKENKHDRLSTVSLICTKCKRTAKAGIKRMQCERCKVNMHYKCLACNEKICRTIAAMYYHKKYNCGLPTMYYCNDCHYKNAQKLKLKYHILTTHTVMLNEDGRAICSKCGITYRNGWYFRKHQFLCGKRLYKCRLCSISVSNTALIQKHLDDVHESFAKEEREKLYKEIIAAGNKMIRKARKAANIIKIVPKKHKPAASSKIQIVRLSMTQEEKLSTQHLIKRYCAKCDRTSNKSRKKCPTCKEVYKYRCGDSSCVRMEYPALQNLRRHIKSRHIVGNQNSIKHLYECSGCGKRFTFYDYLRSHKKHCEHVQQIDVRYRFRCDHCNFAAKWRATLARHVKRAHGDLVELASTSRLSHVCPSCNKSFEKLSSLRAHQTRYCGRKRSFACDHCSRLFYTKSDLTNHIITNNLLLQT